MERTEMMITIVTSIVNSIALIVGGLWAFNNFIRSRAGVWNLNIVIDPQIIEVKQGINLLIINITLQNRGCIKITPGPSGCRVRVTPVNIGHKKLYEEIMPESEKPIYDGDILKKYFRPNIGYKNYEIEPNAEYHEDVCFLIKKEDIVEIRVEFFYKKDSDSIAESMIYNMDDNREVG